MAHIPEYYGENFSLYLNDASDKAALIIQGVNILGGNNNPSVIYSKRSLEIGGGLVKSVATYTAAIGDALGQTTRHVNSNIDGYSYGYAPVWTNYFPTTTRYSQIVYNTDIVLRTPDDANTPRFSRIFDASLPDDGAYGKVEHDGSLQNTAAKTTHLGVTGSTTTNNFSDDYNKQFSPTVRIIGGHTYVGAGQTLAIDGGRINPKNTNAGTVTFEGRTVTLGTTAGEYTQIVVPDSLTVATGGSLTLRGQVDVDGGYVAPSAYANVNTDIFVSGAMTMESGSKAKGNIIVRDGGAVTMSGTSQYEGDIHITSGGAFTIGSNARITGNIYIGKGGTMTIQPNSVITGDVRCSGELIIEGSFELNCKEPATDDENTPQKENEPGAGGKYIYHGIFIYNSPSLGTGTLNIKVPTITTITGDSGKIHTFAGYPGVPTALSDNIFCDDHDDSNLCKHWTSETSFWQKQGGIVRE
jgi:hypothetical protein